MAIQYFIASTLTYRLRYAIFATLVALLIACQPSSINPDKQLTDDFQQWGHYGGDPGNSHYSRLVQINRSNVGELALAWSYSSAKQQPISATSELQINPIIVNGILYGRSPKRLKQNHFHFVYFF